VQTLSPGTKDKALAIVLLEDHPLYRDGLENFISKNVPLAKFVYSGDDFNSAKKAVLENKIDIAIVDLHLGDNRPPNELVALFTNNGVPVLVISALNNFESVRSAFAMGAKGFVGKESPVEEILGAINNVRHGLEWINNNLANALLEIKSPSEKLSNQERKALMLYASGLKLDLVARRMNVAPSTAKQYIERAKQKYRLAGIQIRTKTEIYKVLRDEGLVS
jgi:DNA-binding NarL/FixJ family response regulator